MSEEQFDEVLVEDVPGESQQQQSQHVSLGLTPFGAIILSIRDRQNREAVAFLTPDEVYRLVGQLTTLTVTIAQQAMAEQAELHRIAQQVSGNGIVLPPGADGRR